jgi:hypothetical protein
VPIKRTSANSPNKQGEVDETNLRISLGRDCTILATLFREPLRSNQGERTVSSLIVSTIGSECRRKAAMIPPEAGQKSETISKATMEEGIQSPLGAKVSGLDGELLNKLDSVLSVNESGQRQRADERPVGRERDDVGAEENRPELAERGMEDNLEPD